MARQSDELCCMAGNEVEVLFKSYSGWWTIRCVFEIDDCKCMH